MQTQPWANYRNSSKFVWDASRSRIISLVDKVTNSFQEIVIIPNIVAVGTVVRDIADGAEGVRFDSRAGQIARHQLPVITATFLWS